MQTILVANPKGGSGNTTVATNVAGWLAGKRQRVAIEDRDPLRSATENGALTVAIVAMRVDARTRSAAELDLFLRGFAFPLIAQLRDTQVYVHCARDGATVSTCRARAPSRTGTSGGRSPAGSRVTRGRCRADRLSVRLK